LQELVPTARQIAVLINSSGSDAGLTNTTDINVREIEAAAATMNLRTEVFYANNVDQIDATFAAMAQKKVDALLVTSSPLYTSRRVQIVTLATRERLPVIFPSREFADVGGLMAYGTNLAQEYRKMGAVAGSILKGAKPADLPVQQSTTFEFVINLQTARALGFSVPAGLSARADEVIE
jgi:putative ABC transport system substrate-binding protein